MPGASMRRTLLLTLLIPALCLGQDSTSRVIQSLYRRTFSSPKSARPAAISSKLLRRDFGDSTSRSIPRFLSSASPRFPNCRIESRYDRSRQDHGPQPTRAKKHEGVYTEFQIIVEGVLASPIAL